MFDYSLYHLASNALSFAPSLSTSQLASSSGDVWGWCVCEIILDMTFRYAVWKHDRGNGLFWRVCLDVLGLWWGTWGSRIGKLPLPDVDENDKEKCGWCRIFVVAWHHWTHFTKGCQEIISNQLDTVTYFIYLCFHLILTCNIIFSYEDRQKDSYHKLFWKSNVRLYISSIRRLHMNYHDKRIRMVKTKSRELFPCSWILCTYIFLPAFYEIFTYVIWKAAHSPLHLHYRGHSLPLQKNNR